MRLDRSFAGALMLGGALVAAACGGSRSALTSSAPDLTIGSDGLAGSWRLVSLQESGHETTPIQEAERFTAEFSDDGRVRLKADCNVCTAAYKADAGSLSVSPMACTRAACSSAPLDTTYAALVGSSESWSVADGLLELRSSAGVVRFRR